VYKWSEQMMEQNKVKRLNSLFEKMVANDVNMIEKKELNNLYQDYINDGRDNPRKTYYAQVNKVALNA
jgi:uncharacterized protein YnzC (UPF0291/DUF896 family)